MKAWMLALSFVAVLGMTGLADAKGKNGKGGIRGKIESVTGNSFTITVGKHGKKNAAAADAAAAAAAPKSMTVKFDDKTTITVNGAAGKIDASMVGKRVSVIGGTTGDTITATQITVTDGHHKKKKAA